MKQKLYKCNECQKEVPIRSKGLCTYCRQKQKGSVVKRYIFKQTTRNKAKKEDKKAILEPFFEYHLKKVQVRPFCDNCGCRIQGNICNIAHILPKGFGRHTEVMGELENALYLCASVNGGQEVGCHEHFDRVQGSSKVYLMNCWTKAVQKYVLFREKVVKYSKYKAVFEDWLEENE